jgi:alpha-mannosidase
MHTSAVGLEQSLEALTRTTAETQEWLARFTAELAFARELSAAHPECGFDPLLEQAVEAVTCALRDGAGAETAVRAAEAVLAPVGALAKTFTLHCVGHAHLDMNWMWNWPETVATVNDTYATVNKLMDEFPDFRFAQSQTSIYQIMKDYTPRLYETVKQRIREGRWEIVANQWVEGDKNCASGESIVRHLLYTKRFFETELGIPYDAITLNWEPDTFGHAHTVPTLLGAGGVKRYYFCRTGPGPQLFWWQGTDGTRLLAFDDNKRWYNARLDGNVTKQLIDFEQATGLRDYLFIFGVGDHGGGPTREDLRRGVAMGAWPIFPNVIFSTTKAFFDIVEAANPALPVIDAEMNTIFEACYTSQSGVKHANRRSENVLVEAEACALLGAGVLGLPYPQEELYGAWKHTLLNQFHDILPGSGVHATYEYAQGLFQEILARTTMIKTEVLRGIAARVNTVSSCLCPFTGPAPLRDGQGLGGGFGDIRTDGAVTRYGAGGLCCDPFVIFNPNPWSRSEVVTARLWNRDIDPNALEVRDDAGKVVPAQFLEQKSFWWLHHEYIEIAFPAERVPGLGYRTYNVGRATKPRTADGCTARITGISMQGAETDCFSYAAVTTGEIENELLKVVVEQDSGAIVHLIDKRTGVDLVPPGGRLGLLQYLLEAPQGMSAWNIGQIRERHDFTTGAVLSCPHKGPYLGTIRVAHTLHDSTFTLDISLTAGSPRVDFTLNTNWLERGGPDIGVPTLKVAFPLALSEPVARYECPNGSVERPIDGREVPAQKWADITGSQGGVTLVNESKYGFSASGDTLSMSILRSSYDPDPLPELGKHTVKFGLVVHDGAWTAGDATRAGYAFNMPLNVVNTDDHEGDLPMAQGYAELLTPSVMLSGLKRAEVGEALIVRLYEMEGTAITARLRLHPVLAAPDAPAVQTDVLEQPLAANSASMDGGVLSVDVPPFGMVTVKIG